MLINKIFDSASFHKIFVRYRSIYMTSWSIIPQIKENICRIQLTEDQNDSQIEFNCGKEKKKNIFFFINDNHDPIRLHGCRYLPHILF